MKCEPVFSLRRSRKSSNTSPQAQACKTALSVSTPSTSNRQALTVAGRPSIPLFTGTGDNHGVGRTPAIRARRSSCAAVCWRSRVRAYRRWDRSDGVSEPSAACRARSAASRALCQWALIVSSSSGCRGRAAAIGAHRIVRTRAARTRRVVRRLRDVLSWRSVLKPSCHRQDPPCAMCPPPQLLAEVLRPATDDAPRPIELSRPTGDLPRRRSEGGRRSHQTCAGTRESTRWVSSTSRFE